MKLKKNSIKLKIWLYFLLFAVVILCGLWLFQTVFINGYYRNMKQNSIVSGAQTLVEQYAGGEVGTTYGQMAATAMENDLAVNIVDLDGTTLFAYNPAGRRYGQDLALHFNGFGQSAAKKNAVNQLARQIQEEESGALFEYFDNSNGQQMFVYSTLITDANGESAVLIVTSQLQPLNETVKILSEQLIYVTVGILGIAFILSFVIAQKVSRPLEKITEKAAVLSQGNYDVTFEAGGYSEVNQLAHTLNYATSGLKQVEKLRTELISNVSHDLRTPLTMIKAYAEMIRDISGNNEEKRNQHLAVIVEECDRLSDFVQELLDVSKLQAGVIEYHPMEFNLSELIQKTLGKFDVLKEKQGYTIVLQGRPDVFAYGDEKKIEQALYNLLSNAVNYTGEDKKIFISLEETEQKVRVSIRDTGLGIPKEDLEHIWERYYRVDKEHKRAVAGSGIGLAIVKSVFLLHKTDFGVESEPGHGSIFWFELYKREPQREN